jgi:hypothetical protein
LIGTYEGLPFYADEELTDEQVQAEYIYGIRNAIARLESLGEVPAKTVMKEGRIKAFPSSEEDDPFVW